jgi:hypothetical protein
MKKPIDSREINPDTEIAFVNKKVNDMVQCAKNTQKIGSKNHDSLVFFAFQIQN